MPRAGVRPGRCTRCQPSRRTSDARQGSNHCGAARHLPVAEAPGVARGAHPRPHVKRTLYLIVALVAGAAIASALRIDAGYVAISFLGVLIEMSVVTLVLLILATFLLLWLLVRLVRMRKLRREAQAARREQRARLDLARGVLELAEGNWPTAEITVTRSARDDVQPAVNYLIAARAADLQGAHERRAGWLRMAREAAPNEIAPVLVTQAEMQLKHKQLDAARTTLQELDASGQQNPRGLLLLARLY